MPNTRTDLKKILHICNDDKFITPGKIIFDSVPDTENEFWVHPNNGELQHCKFECENIYQKDLTQKEFTERINQFNLICIHFMSDKAYRLLLSGKVKIPVFWIGWGGDYYWLIESSPDFHLYRPETHKLVTSYPYFL